MGLATYIVRRNPRLVKELRIAHIKKSPETFVKQALLTALMVAIAIGFVTLLFVLKFGKSKVLVFVSFILGYAVTYLFIIQIPKGIIRRREREINKEILFAGRYLLVKLESGMPLFNALIDISKSYGVAAKYFKEIVDDIQTGTPIEEALEKAREYNASKKFQRILWQIVTSLKTGIEVSSSLRTTLKDITNEQILEIKAYGKTLNSLMMFYMILGCVLPSLGVALFTIFSSFLSLQITSGFIFFMVFILIVIQVAFIIFIHATRPMVNL
ncbi:hypothetical protein DRJ48_04805 [Candidatus Woesearchaeota archaeon]|nr:MAG: hypothetical protein DRJ48_04805 [Candidatus Woesearchaeota archaeon]